MQIIHLSVEDDIVSICDRLQWSDEGTRVVLVLPPAGNLLVEHLDLVRLRRQAERCRLEVGLVTRDGRVVGRARSLGIPTFGSVIRAEKSGRRWWRRRKAWHAPTLPGASVRLGAAGKLRSLPDDADRREIYRRMAPIPGWRQWLLRYVGIVFFFLTLAVLVVAVAYAIPGATVTLYPEVAPLRVTKQIAADPQLESVSVSGASVPARRLTFTEVWQAEVATTGSIAVPDAPARGSVVFVNALDQPVTVPAGTRVTTSTGTRIVFQTIVPVDVPGTVGATVEADVVAVEPGPDGNVDANLVNRIEGPLQLQLQVRNLEAMTGGGVRIVPAVAPDDQERLRAQVLQYLQTLALAEMQASLAEQEFLARDSLRVTEVYDETYSHFPGERTDRLALEIRAEVEGTAIDATQTYDLVYDSLAEALQSGYELVPESINFYSDEVLGVDGQGRVTFVMVGEALMAAALDADEEVARVAGQETGIAMSYLYENLPLRDYPDVRVWPDWFGRLPYLPVRISTEINTGSQGS